MSIPQVKAEHRHYVCQWQIVQSEPVLWLSLSAALSEKACVLVMVIVEYLWEAVVLLAQCGVLDFNSVLL